MLEGQAKQQNKPQRHNKSLLKKKTLAKPNYQKKHTKIKNLK